MINRRRLLAGAATFPLPTCAEARKHNPKPKSKLEWRWKTVTRTFVSRQAIISPPFGTPLSYPATINVQGLTKGKIQKVIVMFTNVVHSYPSELDIMLVAPTGRGTILMSDAGDELRSDRARFPQVPR